MLMRVWRGLLVITMLVACHDREASNTRGAASTQPRDAGNGATDKCISDSFADRILTLAERNQDIDHAHTTRELVSSSCTKRIYNDDGARVVMWRGEDGLIHSTNAPAKPYPTTPPCFERAVERAATLVPYGRSLLAREARVHPTTWNDPDIGAAGFVACDADQQPTIESIETLLHETNHGLADHQHGCLHEFTTDQPLCFALDARLPRRSIARVSEPVPGFGKNETFALSSFQDIYLGVKNPDEGPIFLFDELMAYRITSDMQSARLLLAGKHRTEFNNLPLVMDLSVRYVLELASRDATLAEQTFGPQTENRAHLLALLDQAEGSYRSWLASLSKLRQKPTSFERTFWEAYQRDRRRWTTATPLSSSR
jgi:hypothetical protein